MPTTIKRAAGNVAKESGAGPADVPTRDHQLDTMLKPFEAVIEYRAIAELKVNPRNARRHSKKQVQQIAARPPAVGQKTIPINDIWRMGYGVSLIVLSADGLLSRVVQLLMQPTASDVGRMAPSESRCHSRRDSRIHYC